MPGRGRSMSASAALLSSPDSRTVLLLMVSHISLVASSMSAGSVCLGPDSGGSEALSGLAALLTCEASLGSVSAESEYCLQAGAEAYSLACSQLTVALLRHGGLSKACYQVHSLAGKCASTLAEYCSNEAVKSMCLLVQCK